MMTTETCIHIWFIEPADGPASWGVCQNCGETREFLNHIDVENWREKGVKGRAAKKAQTEMREAEKAYDANNLGLGQPVEW